MRDSGHTPPVSCCPPSSLRRALPATLPNTVLDLATRGSSGKNHPHKCPSHPLDEGQGLAVERNAFFFKEIGNLP